MTAATVSFVCSRITRSPPHREYGACSIMRRIGFFYNGAPLDGRLILCHYDAMETGGRSSTSKRVAIYARVSTSDQTAENQLLDLRRYCASRGWEVVGPFTDVGISGTKKERPHLSRLMEAVRKRQVDGVLVWRFDRFARSVSHLVSALEEFRKRGVGFASYQEGVDTDTPQGEFFFTIIAAMAQFERAIIVDRIHAGLRRAREDGKRFGRPSLSESEVARILAERGKGSTRQIAARLGFSKSLVQRVLSQKGSRNVASVIDETPVAFRVVP